MVITDESKGIFQLLGTRARAVPQSLRLCLLIWLSRLHCCLYMDVARKAFCGWIFGAFLLILGEFLGTFRLLTGTDSLGLNRENHPINIGLYPYS